MRKTLLMLLALVLSAGSLLRGEAPAQGRTQVQTPDATPSTRAGGAYYEFVMGLSLEMEGDAAGAMSAYERAARLDPESAEIPAALAELYARQNRTPEALAAAQRALSVDPANAEANWILGQLYNRLAAAGATSTQDRVDFARRAIDALEKADRNVHPSVPLTLGQLYFQNREFAKAISVLGPYVAEQPDQSDAVTLLAETYEAVGRGDDATALLEGAVDDAPELYTILAQRYEATGRWQDAAKAYQAAALLRPSLQLSLQWATALLNTGKADQAVQARKVLQEASAASSSNPRALYLLSEAQRRGGDLAAAEVTGRRLMALDQDSLLGAHALAQIYEDQRDYHKVVGLLDPIVTVRLKGANASQLSADPNFRRLYVDLADAHERLKEFDKAIAVLTQARTVAPDDPSLSLRIARVQQNAGRGDSAISTLQTAAARFPREPLVSLELGAVLGRQKRFAEAERVFRQMIDAAPESAEALNYLGYMLAERGLRLDESVGFVRRALALEPGNPAYLDSLGWAYFKQGRFDLAEEPLRAAAAQMPSNSVVQSHLGDVCFRRGQYQEAIDAWQRALDGDGESIKRSTIEDQIKTARQRLDRNKKK